MPLHFGHSICEMYIHLYIYQVLRCVEKEGVGILWRMNDQEQQTQSAASTLFTTPSPLQSFSELSHPELDGLYSLQALHDRLFPA